VILDSLADRYENKTSSSIIKAPVSKYFAFSFCKQFRNRSFAYHFFAFLWELSAQEYIQKCDEGRRGTYKKRLP